MAALSEDTWADVVVLSFDRLSSPVPRLSRGEKQCGSLPFSPELWGGGSG